jgi:hypothetical protein
MEETKMKKHHIPRKGFKITIYGVADYHKNGEGTLDFAQTVNEIMAQYLSLLQDALNAKDGQFISKSSFSNCEIMGHSNKEYPDQVF